jgi:peroxiredoxin Q/BCP
VVAGISANTVEEQRAQAARLDLPYRLCSDSDRAAARALGILRRIGIAGWTIELYRRVTVLVDRDGTIAGVWGRVKVRGHARQVMAAVAALQRTDAPGGGPLSPAP